MRDEHPVVTTVLVAVGGAAGASLRYAVSLALGGPAGTLTANVLGSFALGLLVASGERLSARTRLALGGGLLSSFTTYSTFAVETLSAPPPVAVAYVVGSLALGFGAAVLADALVEPGLAGYVQPPGGTDGEEAGGPGRDTTGGDGQ